MYEPKERMMQKLLSGISVVFIALVFIVSGVYIVDTGNVAVEKTLGKVNTAEIGEGIHWRFPLVTTVREYSAKTIVIDLNDLSPKAADNLSLRDLDVSIYYRTSVEAIAELAIKYASSEQRGPDAWLPAYGLVFREARSAVYDAVSEIESLRLHRERDTLANIIESQLAMRLNEKDPDTFLIDRVVIRALNTDPTIEAAIQMAVQNQKRLEAKQVEVDIAEKDAEIEVKRAYGIAEANRIINTSLTAEYLQHEVNEALKLYGANGCPATIIPANMQGINLLIDSGSLKRSGG